MKKLIALLLCLMMVVSVFAGCTPDAPKPTDGDKETNGTVNNTLPDDLTLTIGVPMQATTEDYDTNAYTLWLEEVTGYDLKFQVYQTATADYKSQLSVAMVDGDKLPDLLLGFYLGEAVYREYGEDGYFLDLAPFFADKEGKAKTWWDKFNVWADEPQRAAVLNTITEDDGAIYVFPHLEQTKMDAINHQVYINTEWLKALNLEMPKDPESLYNVLKAFKTQDPNGNGKTDEIPLMGAGNSTYGNLQQWLMSMFCHVSHNLNSYPFRVDESGKLYHIFTSNEYREGLKFINKLITEGLMPASSLNTNNAATKAAMSPVDGVQTIGVVVGHASLIWPADAKIEQYSAMPYWGPVTVNDQMQSYCCFITTDCEYPEAAWNVLMAMTSDEGAYRMRYGEKGVDWVDADPGTKSYTGDAAVIKVLNTGAYSDMNNQTWHHTMGSIIFNSENEVTQLDDNTVPFEKERFRIMAECYTYFYEAAEKYNPTNIAPKIVYNTVADEAIKTQRTNSTNWIKNNFTSFICGTGDQFNNPNDDAQWKAYCDGLTQQGMDRWMEVAQKLYEEQNK